MNISILHLFFITCFFFLIKNALFGSSWMSHRTFIESTAVTTAFWLDQYGGRFASIFRRCPPSMFWGQCMKPVSKIRWLDTTILRLALAGVLSESAWLQHPWKHWYIQSILGRIKDILRNITDDISSYIHFRLLHSFQRWAFSDGFPSSWHRLRRQFSAGDSRIRWSICTNTLLPHRSCRWEISGSLVPYQLGLTHLESVHGPS